MRGNATAGNRKKNDQKLIVGRILGRAYFDSPASRLAVGRAKLSDRLVERTVLIVILVVDENLEPVPADRVDQRVPGQQDLAGQPAAAMPGSLLWGDSDAEPAG